MKKQIKIERHEREEISRVVLRFLDENRSPVAMTILFGGDRATCCDECLIATDDADEFVGMASISYQGEGGDGFPEIVGLYVLPECRRLGVGRQLLETAVRRILGQGYDSVRISAISGGCVATVNRLPADIRGKVDMFDEFASNSAVLDL